MYVFARAHTQFIMLLTFLSFSPQIFSTTLSISPTDMATAAATHLKTIYSHHYLPHIAVGTAIITGGGYYWYLQEQKKIDYTPNYDPEEPRCEIPGMVGACPPEIAPLLKQLKEDNKQISIGFYRYRTNLDNVLLLEGPTGIGKTALAQAIAKNTDSHFVEIYGADVLNSFIGGGKDMINERIAIAIAEGEALMQRTIIFIDEIDAFSCSENSTARTEYEAAYKALWRHIDNNKHNPQVFFIFATNHLTRVPVELRNRVDVCIHMKNPDASQRMDLLNYFSKDYTGTQLNEYCSGKDIEQLIRATKNFSVRNISNLCKHAHLSASRKNEPISPKHLMKELEKIKNDVSLQQTPNKEEQEREHLRNINNENLIWNRIGGIWTILNILGKIADIEIIYS